MKFKKITKYEDLPQENGDYLVYLHSYIFNASKVVQANYNKEQLQWTLKFGFDDDPLNALLPCYYSEDELNTLYISHWAPMPEFEEEDDTTCEEIKNEHLSRN